MLQGIHSNIHTCLALNGAVLWQVLKGKQDERTARAFVKEMSILSSSRHPQILQYLACPDL